MAAIHMKQLNKMYGSFQAIHDLALDVQDGEFVILVGPSGCGKSTLLRMLAGLESITGGEIQIDGAVVNDLMPRQRGIAMVFQSYALYPHMTVAQNIGFSLKLEKRPRDEIGERVRAVAEILALEPLLSRRPSQLSGGQRQRVAMGRAIVRNPKVFLFDEPLSNLDAKLRVKMRAEIKALHERLKTTIVYVTHDQVEAMTMADKIVVMNEGRIEQTGSPLDLYDRPANRFVAEFLGSPEMNMMRGRIVRNGTQASFETSDGQSLPLPNAGDDLPSDRAVLLGVRPEHLSFGSNGEIGLAAQVAVIEPTGSDTLLVGTVGSNTVTCEVQGRISLKSGQIVQLIPDPEHLHFFDSESGQRLND